MRKLIATILILLLQTTLGHTQPGPVPSPFIQSGSSIYPQSSATCLIMPRTVTGGCEGAGTINAQGLYVNGVPVTAAGTLSPSTTISGITNGYVLYNNAGVLGGLASTGTGDVVRTTSPTISGLTVTGSFTAPGLVGNAALVNSSTTVNGQTCTLGSSCTISSAATSITVGTTTVNSGTSGRVLYNNGGTLGEYTVTGAAGSVVLSASPSISGTLNAEIVAASGALNMTTNATPPALMGLWNSAGSVLGIKGAAGGVAITNNAINANNWTIDDSGNVVTRGTTTLNDALTYGGVTLANSVTGTGSMVLSASPTFTGTLAGAAATLSGKLTVSSNTYPQLLVQSASGTLSAAIDLVSTGASARNWRLISGDDGWFYVYNITAGSSAAQWSSTNGMQLNAALTYGGVTLANSVTGTGSMVLSASPTITTPTVSGALTYGGVTLANSVTGTGSMVLSASPTFTGTVVAEALTGVTGNFSASVTGTGAISALRATNGSGTGQTSLYLYQAGMPTNQKAWELLSANASGDFIIRTINDAYDGSSEAIKFSRGSGNTIASATITPPLTLAGTLTAAAANFSGGITAPAATFTTSDGQVSARFAAGSGKLRTWGYFSGASTLDATDASELNYSPLRLAGNPVYLSGNGSDVVTVTSSLVTIGTSLNYGGTTLSNSVTGTGSMVLSSNPAIAAPTVSNLATAVDVSSYAMIAGRYSGGFGRAALNTAGAYGWEVQANGTAVLQIDPTLFNVVQPIRYGGVTLSNSVTGTGSMVLDANPSLSAALTIFGSTGLAGGGITGNGYKFFSTTNFGVFGGTGAPTLSAAQGSIYLRNDGQPYYNTNGSTTWALLGASVYGAKGGLTTERVSTSQIGVNVGAASDSTGTVTINLGSYFIKSTGGAWTSGSGNNGMGNGLTIGNNTWYDVCLAYNGGTADIWFDTSNRSGTYAECANKPTGISGTYYRRIGSFLTDGSANIRLFLQTGNYFRYGTGINTVNGPAVGNGTTDNYAMEVPTGFRVIAQLSTWGACNQSVNWAFNLAPIGSTPDSNEFTVVGGVTAQNGNTVLVATDEDGQIQINNVSCSGGSVAPRITTIGYYDTAFGQ